MAATTMQRRLMALEEKARQVLNPAPNGLVWFHSDAPEAVKAREEFDRLFYPGLQGGDAGTQPDGKLRFYPGRPENVKNQEGNT